MLSHQNGQILGVASKRSFFVRFASKWPNLRFQYKMVESSASRQSGQILFAFTSKRSNLGARRARVPRQVPVVGGDGGAQDRAAPSKTKDTKQENRRGNPISFSLPRAWLSECLSHSPVALDFMLSARFHPLSLSRVPRQVPVVGGDGGAQDRAAPRRLRPRLGRRRRRRPRKGPPPCLAPFSS